MLSSSKERPYSGLHRFLIIRGGQNFADMRRSYLRRKKYYDKDPLRRAGD